MSSISRAKVVATLRDLARQAASAADRLERDASTDTWAHKSPSYQTGPDTFSAFTKAEVEERNEGLRCAMLLAERALSAVHCLSAPGAPYVIETNARAACAGWEAVHKADALPLDPNRTPMSEPDPKDKEAASLLFTLLWEVRHVYGGCVGRPHEDYNVRALLWGAHWPSFLSRMTGSSRSAVPYVPGNGGVFGRFHEVFPGGNPIPEAEAIALLAVMHDNPGKWREGLPARLTDLLYAWLFRDIEPAARGVGAAMRIARDVLKVSLYRGKRMAVTPETERQREKAKRHRRELRAEPQP